jgi:succinate dehydrogenase/fumarate reductase-like Fe-S protein
MSGAINRPTALLRVWRGQPDQPGGYETFEVPYEEGMSVLDGLRWIRARLDPTLAVRYSCINANVCKTCMALVNGEVKYTCTARLQSTPTTVAPLPKRSVIRDLVTNTAPADERPAHLGVNGEEG